MADRSVDILLVGGGVAAASSALTLRSEGFDGSVLLVAREPDAPYHRPPVSKEYLRGAQARTETLVYAPGWWKDNEVELLTRTSVLGLDLDAGTATLSTKEEVAFDQALIATGAMVRRLSVDGSDLEGIHYLRVLANADALRRDVEDAERIVCVGGSYIGSEVAASLTELGKHVTVLMQEAHILERHFGGVAAVYLQGVLQAHGVEVVGRDEVDRFDGDGDRVQAVLTKAGRRLHAEAVVCGVGALPDVMLARKAGLEIGERGGVRCDRYLRTSSPRVFAAGDMCEYESAVHGRTLRIEHEEVAIAQGSTAALNMLGRECVHEELPYFFSDLSDWASLEYVGPAEQWDEEVVRGSVEDGRFAVWYVEAGAVRAMLSVNGTGDLELARQLIAAGGPPPAA